MSLKNQQKIIQVYNNIKSNIKTSEIKQVEFADPGLP